jgi:hypothetical protein
MVWHHGQEPDPMHGPDCAEAAAISDTRTTERNDGAITQRRRRTKKNNLLATDKKKKQKKKKTKKNTLEQGIEPWSSA